MYTRFSSPKILHSLYQVPVVKTQLTFHSPDALQHNFVPRMTLVFQRTKTTPFVKKLQNHHLVQLKGVIEHPGLTHLLGTQNARE